MAKKLHFTGLARDAPKLSLPGKLVFPSMHNVGHFSMLGLGDIVRHSYWIRNPWLVTNCGCCSCAIGDARSASLFRPTLWCLQEVAVAPLGRDGRASAQTPQSNHVSWILPFNQLWQSLCGTNHPIPKLDPCQSDSGLAMKNPPTDRKPLIERGRDIWSLKDYGCLNFFVCCFFNIYLFLIRRSVCYFRADTFTARWLATSWDCWPPPSPQNSSKLPSRRSSISCHLLFCLYSSWPTLRYQHHHPPPPSTASSCCHQPLTWRTTDHPIINVWCIIQGDLRRMWDEPFLAVPQPKQLHVWRTINVPKQTNTQTKHNKLLTKLTIENSATKKVFMKWWIR